MTRHDVKIWKRAGNCYKDERRERVKLVPGPCFFAHLQRVDVRLNGHMEEKPPLRSRAPSLTRPFARTRYMYQEIA